MWGSLLASIDGPALYHALSHSFQPNHTHPPQAGQAGQAALPPLLKAAAWAEATAAAAEEDGGVVDGEGEGEVEGGKKVVVVAGRATRTTSGNVKAEEEKEEEEERTVGVGINVLGVMIIKSHTLVRMPRKPGGRMRMGKVVSWGTRKKSPWLLGIAGQISKGCK